MKTLTQNELAEIEGGFGPVGLAIIWLTGAVVGAGISTISENWPDFKKGVMEGYSGAAAAN